MDLGNTVKQLREQRGWRQEDLAFHCGTTAATISRIETGKNSPGDTLLTALAQAFGLRIYQLIAHAEGVNLPDKPALYDREEELVLNYYRAMARDRQELFRRVGAVFAAQD